MSTQILQTKLYTPASRPGIIQRPQLIDRLNIGLHQKLTLVSAPAGFGKTTLVTEWLSMSKHPVAWLSLDEADNDPARFITYVIAALQRIAPQTGTHLLKLLESPQLPQIETLLTPLLNDIAAIPQDFVLVLDDYHVLDSQEVDAALAFLVDRQPPQMHLVITTREDPPLPLARLRARGMLTELRAADLRFSSEEAAEFLNQTMGLNLTVDDIATLEARTEGWIAGLQLAVISMQGHQNAHDFIQSFSGSHHFVLDYLIEEVLSHQPAHIQDFLLKTAILDRMCAPLCAAILEDDEDTQATLEHIRQANLFLIPLDHERRWYRYHHLFGDLLRKRLGQFPDIDVTMLHIRASDWYEANGFEIDAFQHAAAANDIQRATHIIEGDGTPLYLRGGLTPILRWLRSLPHNTPALLVMYAVVSTVAGQQINDVEDKLHAAEIALRDGQNHHLLGQIAAVRGMLAVPRGDIQTMLDQSRRALELLNPDSVSMRLFALWTKGLAHQQRGELDSARQVFAETAFTSESTGNTMMALAALTGLGQLQEQNNQLHQAQQSYQRVLALAGNPPWAMACEAYLGLARIHYAQHDMDQAGQYAQQGLELGTQIENVDTPIECAILLAKVHIARRNIDDAESMLAEGERLINARGFTDKLTLIQAERARIQHNQPLIEPLSERELEVLRLIIQGLSNREIGERLFLALDTIKGHNRRIFAKLGVQRRTEAIARAQELGLL